MLLPTIVGLLIGTANSIYTTTCNVPSPTLSSDISSLAFLTQASTPNATIFAPLAAPLYHNVTAGEAWVFPSSANDLGARDMSCECFNPDVQCCMPASSSLAPFCMPNGSTCCGDTFCVAGESCCGGFCCPANTVCNAKLAGSGCCLTDAICSDPPTCYDHASSNCTNRASPSQQCCPPDMPFCRNFQPSGLGCYVSSTPASSTSIVPTMTAADTSDKIFASLLGYTSTSTTKDTVTVTILVLSDGHGGVYLEFPRGSAAVGVEEGGETTYVLDWPARYATAITDMTSGESSEGRKTEGSSTATATVKATTTSTSTSTAQPTSPISSTTTTPLSSPTTSTSRSLLCYDPTANTHSPCPLSSTTTPPSTTTPSSTTPPSSSSSPPSSSSAGAFSPPGATILTLTSQASKSKPIIPFQTFLRNYLFNPDGSPNVNHMVKFTVSVLAFAVLYIYACKALEEAGMRRWLPQRPGDGDGDGVGVGVGVCGDKQKGHVEVKEVKEVEVGHGRAKAKRNGDGDGDKALLLLLAAMDNNLLATDTDTDNDNDADTHTNTNEPETGPDNHTHHDTHNVYATEPQPPPPSNPPITITLLHRTARPFIPPKLIKKEDIRIVQGSARPFVKDEDEDRRMGSLWGGMSMMAEKEGEGMGGKEEGEGKEGGKVGEGKEKEGKEGEGECGGGLGHVFVWTKGEKGEGED